MRERGRGTDFTNSVGRSGKESAREYMRKIRKIKKLWRLASFWTTPLSKRIGRRLHERGRKL